MEDDHRTKCDSTRVRNTANFSFPKKTIISPGNSTTSWDTEVGAVVETLRLESPSPKLAKSFQRFENTFQASLHVALRPQHDLLVRLVDHKHVISRIVQYCSGKPDSILRR